MRVTDDDIPPRVREAEECECGHLPVEHANRGVGQRRGACEVVECGCQKWTYLPLEVRWR